MANTGHPPPGHMPLSVQANALTFHPSHNALLTLYHPFEDWDNSMQTGNCEVSKLLFWTDTIREM